MTKIVLRKFIDDQYTYTFSKAELPKLIPTITNAARRVRQASRLSKISVQSKTSSSSSTSSSTCKFSKWMIKRWSHIDQSRIFSFDHKHETLLISDRKTSAILNKVSCMQIKSKRSNHFQALVRTLSGCSSGYQCLTVVSRSEFVLEFRFSKISNGNSPVDCTDSSHQQEIVFSKLNIEILF